MKKLTIILFFGVMFGIQSMVSQTLPELSHLNGKAINTALPGKPLDHYWSKCVSAGRANEGLRASWQEQLNMVHKACGFEYVRFHGLFHDDMFVFNYDKDSNVVYNWQYVDDVYDRILEIGVKPFVEFSFFPKEMSERATCFWWGGHGIPPTNYNQWQQMVEAFLKHCIQRYGIDEVRTWYFEVWNEPNLGGFWGGTMEQYFELYKVTSTTVKRVDSKFRVGGPATSSYHPAEGVYEKLSKQKEIRAENFDTIQCKGPWIEEFLNYCEKENLPVDFVSSHPYPTTYPFDNQKNYFEMSRTVNSLKSDLTWLNKVIQNSKFKNAEIQLTEWSSSPSNRDHTHDYLQAATYIVKANLDCIGMANSLSYWIFTDIEEEGGRDGSSVFHGGWGLVNFQGIAKPAFHAYRFLNELGNEVIFKEDGFILTKHSITGSLTGLAYNYPAEVIEAAPISKGSRDKAEKTLNTGSPKQINLNLTGLKPSSKFEIEIVDKDNAFALKSWQAMGSPEPPTREQTKELKALGLKTLKIYIETNSKGELKWNYSLKPWAIALINQIK